MCNLVDLAFITVQKTVENIYTTNISFPLKVENYNSQQIQNKVKNRIMIFFFVCASSFQIDLAGSYPLEDSLSISILFHSPQHHTLSHVPQIRGA